MAVVRAIFGLTRGVAFLATVLLFAAGPPLLWVWVGSQVQGGTAPSATAIVTVIAGMVVSYMLLGVIVAWLVGRSDARAVKPVRYAWNRSMRAERHEVSRGNLLEDLFVAAALLVTVTVVVWFLLYGNPGVPVSP